MRTRSDPNFPQITRSGLKVKKGKFPSPSEPRADIVLIAPLPEECEAMLDKLPGFEKLDATNEETRIDYIYNLSVTFSNQTSGKYRLVVTSLPGKGKVKAAAVTVGVINRWHPRYVILVGIAGGIGSKNVLIGDILIADKIVDYEMQKVPSTGSNHRREVLQVDQILWDAYSHIQGDTWQNLIKEKRPIRGNPTFHNGTIASGDKVVADINFITRIQDEWPDLIGVEMEAAGVATAALQSPDKPGFFMVRCVSDLADDNRDSLDIEAWRSYACDAAAAFTSAILRSGQIPLSNEPGLLKQVTLTFKDELNGFPMNVDFDIMNKFSAILRLDQENITLQEPVKENPEINIKVPADAANYLHELGTKQDIKLISLGIKTITIENKRIIELPSIKKDLEPIETIIVPFVCVAMKWAEAEKLKNHSIFDHIGRAERKRFKEFQKELEKIHPLWHQNYFSSRDAWRPHTHPQQTIGEIIYSLIDESENFVKESRGTLLIGKSISEKAFSDNLDSRSDTWNYIKSHGGIIIVDAISLFHPGLREVILQSGILANESISFLILSPINPNEYPVNSRIEDLVQKKLGITFERNRQYDSLCEIGAGNLLAIQRWFTTSLPGTVENIENQAKNNNLNLLRDRYGLPLGAYREYYGPWSN